MCAEEQLESEGHKCDECGEVIAFKRDYIRHLRSKHNLRPFECQECGKTFTSMLALQDHTSVHSLENPFRCNICGEDFDRYATMKAHQRLHMEEMDFTCDQCGKRLANALQLKKHLILHEEGLAYSCEVCGKLFGSKDSHTIHLKMHKKERPHVCDICNIGFLSSGGLNRHRKVHRRNEGVDHIQERRCSHCHANFSFEGSLKKHLSLVHKIGAPEVKTELMTLPLSEDRVVEELQEQLNEGYAPKNSELYDVPGVSETLESKFPVEPFRCGICEQSYTDVDLMCDHFTNCHTGEQKFYCDTCCVGCSSEEQMERHKSVHVSEEQLSDIKKQSEDLPHVCQLCGKSYKTVQELSKHTKVHNVHKPYKCTICTASFPIKSALDKHLLVHTGERPFKCDICLKSFRQSAALVRHKLWTHRLKNQNKCEICGKTFFTAALLIYHLDVHGDQGRQLKLKLKEIDKLKEDAVDGENREADNDVDDGLNDREKNIDNKCEYCSKTFPSYVALLTHKLSHKLSASFKCDQCHRTFREKRYLQKHKMTHRDVRSWKCDICKKGFAAKLTLIRHSQVHLREALRPAFEEGQDSVCTLPVHLRCNECNVNFSHKSHYVRHKLLHSGTPLLKCGLCDKMFVHKSDIIRHKVMHSFMFTCEICNRNFHKRSLYLMHRRKHLDEKPFKCKECDKSFSSSSNYNAHRRIHSGDKPFQCDRCTYRCSQSGRLMKHKRMHSGVKPYLCQTCGKFFANAESIKVHQRLHTGDRPFKCGNCNKTFINGGSLSQHMRDHLKEEMFKCDLCHHKFRHESHLTKHKMFHVQQQYDSRTAPTYFMCEICGRVFDKKKYLYTHKNVHTRQKNYTCAVCNKHLASRLALKNHEHIHAGLMPYRCQFCGKEFRSSSNLKRHVRIHDGQEECKLLHCEECKETFLTNEDLDEHSHVHLMMVDAAVNQCPSADNNHAQLYVFEQMNESMDSSQPIIVNNSQQQLFVDDAQPLLVFPHSSGSQFSELRTVSRDDELDSDGSSHHHTVVSTQPSHYQQITTNDTSRSTNHLPQITASHQRHSYHQDNYNPQHTQHIIPGSIVSSHHIRHSVQNEEMEIITHKSLVTSIDESQEESHVSSQTINIVPSEIHELDESQEEIDQNSELVPLLHEELETEQVAQRDFPPPVTKAHQCTVCFKMFAKKQYLTKHMYRHRDVKPHECDVCGKKFAQKFEVVVHKIKHTGEKPYSCDICNKQFRSKVNLNNHKMRHNGEFPFLCSVCRKGFSTQLQLERHVTLHTGMLPFACAVCSKGYSIRLNLVKHMAKAHNQVMPSQRANGNVEGLATQDLEHSHHEHDLDIAAGETLQIRVIKAENDHPTPEEVQSSDMTHHVTVRSHNDNVTYSHGGLISIKTDHELMEDFSASRSISLFPKSASENELALSDDVTLTFGSSQSSQHIDHHKVHRIYHTTNQQVLQGNKVLPSSRSYQLHEAPQSTQIFHLPKSSSEESRTIDIGDHGQVYTTSFIHETLPPSHVLTPVPPILGRPAAIRIRNDPGAIIPTSSLLYPIADTQLHQQEMVASSSEYQFDQQEVQPHTHPNEEQLQIQPGAALINDPEGFMKNCFTGSTIVSSDMDPKLLRSILQQHQRQAKPSKSNIGNVCSSIVVDEDGNPMLIGEDVDHERVIVNSEHSIVVAGSDEKINVENISVAGSDNEDDAMEIT